MTYAVASLQNTMQTIGLMNAVSFQAQWRGRSLEADVRARRIAELLYQLKMTEERWLLGASTLSDGAARAGAGDRDDWRHGGGGDLLGEGDGEERAGRDDRPRARRRSSRPAVPRRLTITIFTVPNATQYNVYIGSGGSLPADSALWLQAGHLGRERARSRPSARRSRWRTARR